jgi:transcriptional regulator with XRE-family HTH domain
MNKPNYYEIIKTARKAKGLTQQELANEAGVSLRTVQRIEKGTEEISGFSLRQIRHTARIHYYAKRRRKKY